MMLLIFESLFMVLLVFLIAVVSVIQIRERMTAGWLVAATRIAGTMGGGTRDSYYTSMMCCNVISKRFINCA